MLDTALTSIFGSTESLVAGVSTVDFLLCCLASIVLGAAVALIYMFRHTYSKNFVVTLALLPLIVQMVITLVNGNLGAGIAVMGVFNLVRFRSIPGSAKDIGSVFLAMAIGLATGMGFIVLAARHGIDLMFDSWGLNLSDQYWFKPVDIDVDWHDVNYFENGYEEALGETLLGGSAPAGTSTARITHSPDTATPGMLSKTWIHRDGTNLLVKSGTGNENREPYNELLATKLLARLLDDEDFVAYSLTERHGRAYSTCPTFVTSETELIPAADVLTAFGVTEGRDLHRGYLEAGQALGVSNLGRAVSKMIVADHLMANFDRHTHNFGLMREVETLDRYRVAPLFDNGCGFYSRATTDELEHGRYLWEAHPFRPYPSQQLALVEDLSWYDSSSLDGFLDDIADVLSLNAQLDERFIEAVQRQTAKQIETVNDLAAERRLLFPGR